jgi:predicted ABC-type ATPase
MPELTVVAGANGAGKSTLTKNLKSQDPNLLLIDPDAIAREICPTAPSTVDIKASRQAILIARQYIQENSSFTVETTLAGKSYLQLMRGVRQQGWQVNLIYVGINNPATNIGRVRQRVTTGGHDVPIEDIRRRYERSLANLPLAIQLADNVYLYDNTIEYQPVATICQNIWDFHVTDVPIWLRSVINPVQD